MSEHTPGPWFYERNDKAATITILGQRWDGNVRQSDKCGDVVTVECATDPDAVMFSPFNPEDEANARLIAAAPEMLAALEACNAAFSSWQVGQIPGRPDDILALVTKVRAAIAKTEGAA